MADGKKPDVNPSTNKSASGPPDPRKKKKAAPPAPGDIHVVVPAAGGAKKNKHDAFVTWANKHGVAAATANDIWYWSNHTPNVDAYLWTSVLLAESGAKHLQGNGQLVSSGQAVGIGQIATSWVGQPIPWDPTHKFTADNDPRTGIANYGVNLRMSATLWGDAVAKYGWKQAYTQGYNPNDPNKTKAWAAIQKTYGGRPAGNPPIGSPSQGPADTTPGQQTGGTPYPTFNDPYVTGINKKGKFTTTNDPNRAMQYNGRPLTRSNFLSIRDQLTSYYVSYTGKRPTNGQILQYVTKGWNWYTLVSLLSNGPNFNKSPIWKQNVANWKNDPTIKNILTPGQPIPKDLARQAILNQWNSDTVANMLRKTPLYLKSNEFAGNVATMLNVHNSIMGTPDSQGMVDVKDAALAGWTPDQYASYLRSQKGYTSSPEYQTKSLGLLSALGLITGDQPILAKGVTPGPGSVGTPTGPLPTDTRVPGKTGVAPVSDLGATLSRA